MDPVTHGLLGAAIGHAGFRRRLGRSAAAWGAAAAMFPDVDTLVGTFAGPFANMVAHRALTHSLLFAPVAGALAGWLLWRFRAARQPPASGDGPWPWIMLMIVALWSHAVLDALTHYGTQLLAPLSSTRFAFPSVPVVEPVVTLVLLGGLLAGLALTQRAAAVWPTRLALVCVTAYLGYGLVLNTRAEAVAREQLAQAGVAGAEVHAFPTMLQLYHRRLVAWTADEVRVGFVSLWKPCAIQWDVKPRLEGTLVDALRATPEGSLFAWFASGQLNGRILREGAERVLELSDLRYGFEPDAAGGLWGIRARFTPAGQMVGLPERFERRPTPSLENIGRLMADAFPSVCRR